MGTMLPVAFAHSFPKEQIPQSPYELDALDRLNVIHVSGTKGKGSTCAFVESILRNAGFRTGLYTSPHLVHARERIRIDGKPISETLFAKHFFTVYNKLKQVSGFSCPVSRIHIRIVFIRKTETDCSQAAVQASHHWMKPT
ncbi:hypothetical protein Y032_0071g544 [Ancylostoma ceylanicum]|uniref:Uncharacterized protein n=1 Tax=Ancylostoma ceylanicum TaxID=53326 RepID=A0A016TX95_9BILA|nr:hypothetical protein Y032_0071g544 [Ancylostoma ceylanicum]